MAIGIGRRGFVATRGGVSVARVAARHARTAGKDECPTITGELGGGARRIDDSLFCRPCSPEIGRMQARLDATLDQRPKSSGALLRRQPTPGSIASAEIRLGEISPEKAKVIREAMARARRSRPSRRQGGLPSKRSRRFNAR